jgi:hypothetical protein
MTPLQLDWAQDPMRMADELAQHEMPSRLWPVSNISQENRDVEWIIGRGYGGSAVWAMTLSAPGPCIAYPTGQRGQLSGQAQQSLF